MRKARHKYIGQWGVRVPCIPSKDSPTVANRQLVSMSISCDILAISFTISICVKCLLIE